MTGVGSAESENTKPSLRRLRERGGSFAPRTSFASFAVTNSEVQFVLKDGQFAFYLGSTYELRNILAT